MDGGGGSWGQGRGQPRPQRTPHLSGSLREGWGPGHWGRHLVLTPHPGAGGVRHVQGLPGRSVLSGFHVSSALFLAATA